MWLRRSSVVIFSAFFIYILFLLRWVGGPFDALFLLTVSLPIIATGFLSWLMWRVYGGWSERLEQQRVMLKDDYLERSNATWSEKYAYANVENLIVTRSPSGEITGLALHVPKKQVDLSGLESLEELHEALLHKLPNAEVQDKQAFTGWRQAVSVAGSVVLTLAVIGLLDYFFSDVRWLSGALLTFVFSTLGLWHLLGRERADGLIRWRRLGWFYLGLAVVYLLMTFL